MKEERASARVTPRGRLWAGLALCLSIAIVSVAASPALPTGSPQEVEVGPPVTPFGFDGDVRSLPPVVGWKAGDPVKLIPRRTFPVEQAVETPQPFVEDPLVGRQREFRTPEAITGFTTPLVNINGQGYSGVGPSDTVGDVGPNHYIQAINGGGGTYVAIYSKAGSLMANFTLDSLGSGSCASGLGDPIVLYDRQADRWMISEFSGSGNYLCVYISKTGDPISGGWWQYGFQCPSFPDYPKYSIWPTDANGGQGSYIVTANDGGPGVYALNRGAMLSGLASSFQRVVVSGIPGFGFQGLYAPADVDGASPPPSAAPAIVMTKRDTEANSGPSGRAGDVLQFYEYNVNWTTPANTTLTGPLYVDIADFDATICGLTTWDCVPQPGTGQKLDPLREPIMHRLQYWNHGAYQTLVGNYTVDATGGDIAGVRWFELRKTSGPWTIFNEGTYSPNSVYRWMGGASSDQSGNIAIAYSVSDATSVYPGIRYTGRLSDDPPGVMTQSETLLVAGSGSQGYNRWGDYAAMGVDPADDCTFWFTTDYMPGSSWGTRIGAFKFDRCGCLTVPVAPVVAAYAPSANRVDVTWNDSAVVGITRYKIKRGDSASGPFAQVAVVDDTSPGVGNGASYLWADTDVSGGSTYYYTVLSDDGVACVSPASEPVSVVATGACTLAPTFAGILSATNFQNAGCGVTLTWNAASPKCDGSARYNIYRDTTSQFTPSLANRIAAGVSGTAYTDRDALTYGTVYYYVVRAWDAISNKEESNLVRQSAITTGPTTSSTPLSETFASATVPNLPSGWAQTWISGAYSTTFWGTLLQPTRPAATAHSVPNTLQFKSYRASDPGYQARLYWTTGLVIPATALQATVDFWMFHDTTSSRLDTIQVQVSTNAGSTWVDAGAPIKRNLGAPSGWRLHSVDLLSFKGNTVRLGFLGTTANGIGGQDMNLDDITFNINDGTACATLQRPSEVSSGSSPATAMTWTTPTTLSWQAASGVVDGYELYRGTQAGLAYLADPRVDSCLRASGAGLQATNLSEDPSAVPGRFYWYLVVAKNTVGAGSAGVGVVLDSSGVCTP